MDEKNLVLLAKAGDKDAFCSLYSIYKDRLYRYAFYKLQNEEDAKDAVSDCVLSAFVQIGALKKAEAFPSWIFRILYCSCSSITKEQIMRRKTEDIDDVQNKLCTDFTDSVEKTELQQALSLLKENEREIVLLSVVGGFKSKEIGKIMDMTSGAVRSNLSRSLKRMKDFLECDKNEK
ncbi:MAG: sigma-70 family RNA polymerase sigma factor [Eubacterium sp.]|nr:sigma-70 family RNA polymerase sigma factor [Eubacterium sp.]